MKKNKEDALKAIEKINNDYGKYQEMISGVSTFAEIPKLDHNPFTCLLGTMVKKNWKVLSAVNNISDVEYTDTETGEVINAKMNKLIAKKSIVDPQKFLKIYASNIQIVFSLSHQAYKVFGYFLDAMQTNKDSDIVYFNIDDCMKFCKVSTHPMIYKGLLELIKNFFICRTNRPWAFYINPVYAFNGNRLIIWNEYIKEDSFDNTIAESHMNNIYKQTESNIAKNENL